MGQFGNGAWTVFVTERKLRPTRFVLSICSCEVRLKELAEQARLKYRDAMNAKSNHLLTSGEIPPRVLPRKSQ
jgi:hypothetical protein